MKQNVKKWLAISGTVVGAVAVGAVAMYFLDPERGSYRRGYIRNKAWRSGKSFSDAMGNAVGNRLPQYWQRAKDAAAHAGHMIDDSSLTQKLRAEVARFADAANDIDVQVNNGYAYLRGAAPRKIAHKLAKRARSISGVLGVENHIALRA